MCKLIISFAFRHVSLVLCWNVCIIAVIGDICSFSVASLLYLIVKRVSFHPYYQCLWWWRPGFWYFHISFVSIAAKWGWFLYVFLCVCMCGGVVGGMKFAEHVLIIRTEIINLKDDYCWFQRWCHGRHLIHQGVRRRLIITIFTKSEAADI